ncbi:MAG: prepilin peptidase [Desulfobacteraceae bacterium]|nr:MAG: prepilin peptidase [Desulfobacteraceae bacterium]
MNLLIMSVLCCGTGIAAFCDLKTGRIPNLLTFPMMLIGVAYHTSSAGLQGLGFSSGGLLLGIAILLVLYLIGGMGAGDAKLLGAVGSMVGSKGVVIAAVFSMLLGFFYALFILMMNLDYARSLLRRLWTIIKTFLLTAQFVYLPPKCDEKQPTLRYALPIALGTMGYVFLKITKSNVIQDFLGIPFSI